MRRLKRTFKRPRTPWNTTQLAEERKLLSAYGLRRKKELWRARTILRRFRQRARELTAQHDPHAERVLMERLTKLGVIQMREKPTADDVLALSIESILDRRLQTLVVKRGMAQTMPQARQFITHGHVAVGTHRVFYPSFIVSRDEEAHIRWAKKPLAEAKKQKPAKGVTEAPGAEAPMTAPTSAPEAAPTPVAG